MRVNVRPASRYPRGMIYLYGCVALYNLLLLLFVVCVVHLCGLSPTAGRAHPTLDAAGLTLSSTGLVALPIGVWGTGLLDCAGDLAEPITPTIVSVSVVVLIALACLVRRRRLAGRASSAAQAK